MECCLFHPWFCLVGLTTTTRLFAPPSLSLSLYMVPPRCPISSGLFPPRYQTFVSPPVTRVFHPLTHLFSNLSLPPCCPNSLFLTPDHAYLSLPTYTTLPLIPTLSTVIVALTLSFPFPLPPFPCLLPFNQSYITHLLTASQPLALPSTEPSHYAALHSP